MVTPLSSKESSYTCVTFTPDFERFKMSGYGPITLYHSRIHVSTKYKASCRLRDYYTSR